MPHVFISYARKDQAAAGYIASQLRERGAQVFIDTDELKGGDNFIERLGAEIAACNCLIFIISPRSVQSDWVKSEVNWARKNDKKIIPVLLEPADLTDFFYLVGIEQVDFQGWGLGGDMGEAIEKLVRALNLPALANSEQQNIVHRASIQLPSEPYYAIEKCEREIETLLSYLKEGRSCYL